VTISLPRFALTVDDLNALLAFKHAMLAMPLSGGLRIVRA
jgi:hypothetical protein